jgi:hypothetical protein
MIDIKSKALNRFGIFAGITGGAAVVVQISNIGEGLLKSICFKYLLVLVTIGISVTLFERLGILRFKYSYSERNSRMFKMSRDCARAERKIWGKIFSDKYYQNYLDDGDDT